MLSREPGPVDVAAHCRHDGGQARLNDRTGLLRFATRLHRPPYGIDCPVGSSRRSRSVESTFLAFAITLSRAPSPRLPDFLTVRIAFLELVLLATINRWIRYPAPGPNYLSRFRCLHLIIGTDFEPRKQC